MENARIALERGQLDYALDATGEILLAAPACVAVRRLQREAQLKRFKTRGGLMARAAVWMAAASLRACADPKRAGRTLAAASSLDKGLRAELKTGADIEAAKLVGRLIAERARTAGVTAVVFDRGGYLFHGRVKALAAAAREAGLSF